MLLCHTKLDILSFIHYFTFVHHTLLQECTSKFKEIDHHFLPPKVQTIKMYFGGVTLVWVGPNQQTTDTCCGMDKGILCLATPFWKLHSLCWLSGLLHTPFYNFSRFCFCLSRRLSLLTCVVKFRFDCLLSFAKWFEIVHVIGQHMVVGGAVWDLPSCAAESAQYVFIENNVGFISIWCNSYLCETYRGPERTFTRSANCAPLLYCLLLCAIVLFKEPGEGFMFLSGLLMWELSCWLVTYVPTALKCACVFASVQVYL